VEAVGAGPSVSRETSAQYPGLRPYDLPEFAAATSSQHWREQLAPYTDADRLAGLVPMVHVADGQEARLQAVKSQMHDLLARYDFVATPTIDQVAPAIADDWSSLYGLPGATPRESVHAYVKYTMRVNLTGLPAASIPCGFVDGMPVGLHLIGRPNADGDVLRASRVFEHIQPWAEKRPPLAD
jgi:Asp-tRNA(Asn)/Glu-tRNA(Gln) amidotransferase A subunit family amidase